MTMEVATLKHLRSRAGTAVCGRPVKQEDLISWGDDGEMCPTCVRLYTYSAMQTGRIVS